jgi:hypothetical protein
MELDGIFFVPSVPRIVSATVRWKPLDVGFATHACQPQLEPPGTGDKRAALRPQSGQDVHRGVIDLHDFREIEHGDAAVHGIEQDLDGVAGQ